MNQTKIIVLNFSHKFTPEQVQRLESHLSHLSSTRGAEFEIVNAPAQFDQNSYFVPQAHQLIEDIGLERDDWRSVRILVNLPALNTIAAIVLAEIYAYCGYFPSIIRMRPNGKTPPAYDVAEIIGLHNVFTYALELGDR